MVKNNLLSKYNTPQKAKDSKRVNCKGKTKMTTLKETANEYVGPTTKNIVELDLVPIDIEIQENEYERKEPKEGEAPTFKVLEIEVEGQKYRVPKTCLEQIKQILKLKPQTTHVSVGKSGEGFATKYTVVAM